MISKVIGAGIDIALTGSTYIGARKEGDSVLSSIAQTITTTAINSLIPTFAGQLAYMGLTVGYDMILQNAKANAEASKDLKYIGSGYVGGSGHFNMSNAGYTMRQRSVEKMRSTGMNINSVLGNEARNYIRSAQRSW
jgi:ABC-type xylose transport system permease subunit